jgi:alpha-beta hydrolase superfamily lysophospholipase
LVIVHGAGDHSGRYSRLVNPLVERGFTVYGYDMRGYGRSPGKRGHINAWADYREDAGAFLMFVKERAPGLPVFLFGYSLGAQVALDYVLRAPQGLEGVVLSATPIEPAGIGNPVMILMAKLLSRVMPTLQISLKNDINGVARDPQVLADLGNDPLHHDLVTMRWGSEAMATGEWVRQRAAEMRLPVLFIHGGADPFNKVEGVQRYYEQISYPDKAIRVYAGSRHETHNDLDHAQVAADIAAWMEEHLTEI